MGTSWDEDCRTRTRRYFTVRSVCMLTKRQWSHSGQSFCKELKWRIDYLIGIPRSWYRYKLLNTSSYSQDLCSSTLHQQMSSARQRDMHGPRGSTRRGCGVTGVYICWREVAVLKFEIVRHRSPFCLESNQCEKIPSHNLQAKMKWHAQTWAPTYKGT